MHNSLPESHLENITLPDESQGGSEVSGAINLKNRPWLQVYVSNITEDVSDLIENMLPKQRRHEIRENALTADRDVAMLVGNGEQVLILPVKPDDLFLKHLDEVVRPVKRWILVPSKNTGYTSTDAKNDPKIISKLIKLGEKYRFRMVSYSASSEFFKLVQHLQSKGLEIVTPEAPESDKREVVDRFGSKTGLRQFYESNASFFGAVMISPGKVCSDHLEAASEAAKIYTRTGGVVLKIPKGHSGVGVMIIKKNSLPAGLRASRQAILEKLQVQPYWQKFPICVEELIKIDTKIAGGNPNVECLVTDKGEVKFLYYCGMRISGDGTFQGIEIGRNVVPSKLMTQLQKAGKFLGKSYYQAGYRGYFDVDCLVDRAGHLFMSESNVRRTGGTHVYHLATAILGKNCFKQYYILSNNYFSLPKWSAMVKKYPNLKEQGGGWTFVQAAALLQPILFDPVHRRGLIIAAANTLQMNKLTYVIIGHHRDDALAIEQKLKKLVGVS